MLYVGEKGSDLKNKIMSSVGGITGMESMLLSAEATIIKYAGERVRPIIDIIHYTLRTGNNIITPLFQLGNLLTNLSLSTFMMLARPFRGKTFDPAADLSQSIPTHHISDHRQLWIPTKGTVHLITMDHNDTTTPSLSSSTAQNNNSISKKIYELSFDFPPSAVKGASDLINPNYSATEKAEKAVRVLVESIVTIPFLAPVAGKIAQTVLHEIIGNKDKKPQ